jgi:hypothetical protein
MEITLGIFICVAFVSCLCEYMDASVGMGYGTTLTPLLLLAGFLPLQVVPSVLLGQLVGGLIGGFSHHKFGNIKLDFRRDEELIKRKLGGLGYIPASDDSKIIFLLVICGAIGALASVLFAVHISKIVINTYIGLMVLSIGLLTILHRNREFTFSWKGFTAIALLSSFNKGISGGGYGPLVTGGQIISGKDARSSVGNATLAEAFVCIVAFLSYLILQGNIYWKLAGATSIGSIVAAPCAAFTVKKVQSKKLKLLIGILTTILGILTLVNMAAT